IFENDEFASNVFNRKASAIVQQVLTDGSALFSFPVNLFPHFVDAHDTIAQLGQIEGLKNISSYARNTPGELLI
ncbi:uncharacterized protein B0P05DRAFT_466303, partial [Gilbertella persicaria]|uniref:uncharacterized protein n=1 Tax=Gilbertella persicaria TaxID=101096 RepID=UPI00222095E7